MQQRLTIGVMGAGSIGCYVGGRLLTSQQTDVILVGRSRLQKELGEHGLHVKDFDEPAASAPPEKVTYTTDPNDLAPCDVVLCCVKSAQTEEVARQLSTILRPDAVVASFQNGVRNPGVLREHLTSQTVLASIVDFNVVSQGNGLFHRTTNGALVLESSQNPTAQKLIQALQHANLGVKLRDNISPDQWTKLLVNLNNAVIALSDVPTRDVLLSPKFRNIVASLLDEALRVLKTAGIKTASFRGVPAGWMPSVLRWPTWLVRLALGAQLKMDPEARSSMWEDLQRGRATEVDYLNGEIVRVAENAGIDAPLHRQVVALIREAESAQEGSPQLDADQLWFRLSS